jgi:RNase P subunit RPR2
VAAPFQGGSREVKCAIDGMAGRTGRTILPFQRYSPSFRHSSKTKWKYFKNSGRAFVCAYCNSILTKENRTFDHVVPQSKGGFDSKWNLVAACAGCNWEKRAQDLIFFMFRQSQKGVLPESISEFVPLKIDVRPEIPLVL